MDAALKLGKRNSVASLVLVNVSQRAFLAPLGASLEHPTLV